MPFIIYGADEPFLPPMTRNGSGSRETSHRSRSTCCLDCVTRTLCCPCYCVAYVVSAPIFDWGFCISACC